MNKNQKDTTNEVHQRIPLLISASQDQELVKQQQKGKESGSRKQISLTHR